jgi:Tfp pilus assembly protein PilF/uncharacterized membrane protein
VHDRAKWTPRILAWLVPAALACAVHLNGVGNQFTFDDTYIIAENPLVTGDGGLVRVFTSHYWTPVNPRGDLYRPLAIASYWINYRLAGPSPASFHLVNLLLHAAVTAVAWHLFLRLSGSALAAACAALVFAVHPVHVEAVVSVVGRAELLSALFVAAAWLLRGRRWLSLLLFACGLLSKENAIVLPGLMLIEDLCSRGQRPGARAALRAVTPYLLLAAAFVALRILVLGFPLASGTGPFAGVSSHDRILTAVAVIGRYLWLLLYPSSLSADYSFNQMPIVSTALDAGFLAGAAGIALSLVFVWLLRRRAPGVALGIVVTFVALLPTSNLLFGTGVVMAERLLYLPSTGFCLAAGAAMEWAASSAFVASRRRVTAAACLMTLLPVSLMAVRSFMRTRDWRDPVSLFEATVRSSPRSALARFGLATAYQGEGRLQEAELEYRRSLEISPDRAETHYNLAALLAQSGRPSEAIEEYRAAIRLEPGNQQAHNNLGPLYEAQGKLDEAEAEYRSAIGAAPGRPGPYFNLGVLLEARGRVAEAIEAYRDEVRIAPRDSRALNNLGRLLVASGNASEAIEVLERAVEQNAAAATPAVNLAAAWLEQGDAARAEAIARRVLADHPGDAAAMRVLEAARKRSAMGGRAE